MNNTDLLNYLLQLTIWKKIEGYPNYEISICGSVRNFTTKRILKPAVSNNGYYFVELFNKKQHKKFKVHRLVAIHFIPYLNNGDSVDHINGEKLDNTISNLRWVSNQQNQFNKKVYKQSTTGIKGVVWIESIKKYRAKIGFNKRTIYLGSLKILKML